MSAAPDLWSRRKARVAAEAAAEAEAQTARAAESALAGRSDAEILAELDLPDPDTLVSGADAVRFMARAVPEHLRRRALRRLWRTNPVLANLDGLVDLEEQMCLMTAHGFEGQGSPDRVDALVWALHDLMIEPASKWRQPKIRVL